MADRINRDRCQEIMSRFSGCSVLVVGDLMADEYLRGTAKRISQEGPVMVVEVESDEFKPGGAANVGNNLRALGAKVSLAGVIGEDEIGGHLRAELASWNVDVSGIITDSTRPTTRKTRIVAQHQQVLRVDREQTAPISETISGKLLQYIGDTINSMDAILISDYRKGVLTRESTEEICRLAKSFGKPVISNPKPVSSRWLSGARVLSLNHFEAEELAGGHLPKQEAALQQFGEKLIEELQVELMVVTRREEGISYWNIAGDYGHVPAHLVEVADGAGAGDSTISAMALALISSATDREAVEIANLAGACVVRKFGVATVSIEEMLNTV